MIIKKTRVYSYFAIGFLLFIFALSVIGGTWYTIDQGERGVILRTGAVIGLAEPGLGFKLPIFDRVVKITVQTQSKVYGNLAAYSRDQQPADLQVSVTYSLPEDQVGTIYSQFGGESGIIYRLVDRNLNEAVRTVFGKYNAVEAVQQRDRLGMDIRVAVNDAVKGPVNIIGVQVENIDFSDAYEASIEQRMLAEVEVQKYQQTAEREKIQADIHIIQAQAEAAATIARAKAEAEAVVLQGNAEAEAIAARGKALRDNPDLVNLVYAEKWDGILPKTMVPNGALPFVNIK